MKINNVLMLWINSVGLGLQPLNTDKVYSLTGYCDQNPRSAVALVRESGDGAIAFRNISLTATAKPQLHSTEQHTPQRDTFWRCGCAES
ncbi:MAG: hypothetical protein WCA35_11865 [Kovacikia sp.]